MSSFVDSPLTEPVTRPPYFKISASISSRSSESWSEQEIVRMLVNGVVNNRLFPYLF